MSFVDGIEKIPNHLWRFASDGSFCPHGFTWLDELHVFSDPSDAYEYRNPKLEIVLVHDKPEPMAWLHLGFHGIAQLKVDDLFCVPGFVVADISDRGWEHVRLDVFDHEEDGLSFTAYSCEVVECAVAPATLSGRAE